MTTLREALDDQFKSFHDGSDQTTLLKQLEQMAEESIDRPSEHVAVLMETRRLAMEVGDWWRAVRAVDQLAQRFEVERYELLAESYSQSAKAKLGRREKLSLFRRLVEFADDLIDAHELTWQQPF